MSKHGKQQGKEKTKWYFNKNEKTFGPVDETLIARQLRTKELSPLDYVSENGGPWKLICKVPAFQKATRESRLSPDNEVSLAKDLDEVSKLTVGLDEQLKSARNRENPTSKAPRSEFAPGLSSGISSALSGKKDGLFTVTDIKLKGGWASSIRRKPEKKWGKALLILLGSVLIMALGFFATKYFSESGGPKVKSETPSDSP